MKDRKRTAIVWSPTWDDSLRGWAAKFIRKNVWRCDRVNEFDDLMQDAYLCFVKVAERYPRVVEPRHFMSLFQTTLRNYMHDHSRYTQAKRGAIEETALDVSELCSNRMGEVTNHGYLHALLAEAPEELQMALILLATDPEAVRVSPPHTRENLNMRLRRVLGVGEGFDFAGQLRAVLA